MFRHEITRAVQNGIKFGQRFPRLASTSSLNILPSPKLTVGKFIENRFPFSTSACCRNLDDQFQKSFQPRDEKELQMSDIYQNVTESAEEVSDEILEEDLDPDAALKFTSKHQGIIHLSFNLNLKYSVSLSLASKEYKFQIFWLHMPIKKSPVLHLP